LIDSFNPGQWGRKKRRKKEKTTHNKVQQPLFFELPLASPLPVVPLPPLSPVDDEEEEAEEEDFDLSLLVPIQSNPVAAEYIAGVHSAATAGKCHSVILANC